MKSEPRWLASIIVSGLVGCAQTSPPLAPANAPAPPGTTTPAAAANASSWLGSARADVIAALGPATVVRFDSGYEVWVYRFAHPVTARQKRERAGATADEDPKQRRSELVMLLTPAGVVAKVRVRAE